MAEPIDCLQTVIAHLSGDRDLQILTAGRVASRHKFALAPDTKAWAVPSKAVTVGYDPGVIPDMYTGVEVARLDVRCFGETPEQAGRVYNRLVAICQDFVRTPVPTENGKALLYQLDQDSGPRSDRDPDVHVDFIQVFILTSVHRDPIEEV